MRKLDHPNIVKIVEFFEDDQNFYIVSEFCKGGLYFQFYEIFNFFNDIII